MKTLLVQEVKILRVGSHGAEIMIDGPTRDERVFGTIPLRNDEQARALGSHIGETLVLEIGLPGTGVG